MRARARRARRALATALAGLAVLTPAAADARPIVPGAEDAPAGRTAVEGVALPLLLPVAWNPGGSWRFEGLTPAERRRFRLALARAPRLVRRIADELDATVVVRARARGCGRGASCAGPHLVGHALGYRIVFSRAHLRTPRVAAFVVAHELAHVVDAAGLDQAGFDAFQAAFRRAPAWRSCFRPRGGRCAPPAEIFADEFARYASGDRRSLSGYHVPPLLGRAAFGRLLARHYQFRPGQVEGRWTLS